MLKYELKKVFTKTSSKVAIILLIIIVCITCGLSWHIEFVNENGKSEYGFAAVQKLKKHVKNGQECLTKKK